MGLFSSKKTGHSLSESATAGMDPRDFARLSASEKKEIRQQTARAAGDTKGAAKGDIKAGVSDFLKGRKGSQGVGKMPPPRKGRSMWS